MLIGLVGKPSAGKSTFFKAATLAEVEISERPFTTIKPNEGAGFVRVRCPETEFKVKCNPKKGFCINSERFVPVKLVDVAGLVPGAHLGKGLGNKFLSDLLQADILVNVVDASGTTDEEGRKVPEGAYNPSKDVGFLEEEIDRWFAGLLKENWAKFVRQSLQKPAESALAQQFSSFKISLEQVKSALKRAGFEGKSLSEWADSDLEKFAAELRKISKPIIVAANKVDLPSAKQNVERLKKDFPDLLVVGCSAEAELALREAAKKGIINYVPGNPGFKILKPENLDSRQRAALEFIQKFLKENRNTGVQQCLNAAVLDFLKCIAVFPVESAAKVSDHEGNILPDAFLLPQGSTPVDLAAKVHTDLAKNFIGAINAKTKQRIGREAELKNLDVIEIISGR